MRSEDKAVCIYYVTLAALVILSAITGFLAWKEGA